MRVLGLILLMVGAVACECANAAVVGFRFDGLTLFSSQLYGRSIPALTPFSGHAIYESTSAPTHTPGGCVDCVGHQQVRSNGMSLVVGDVTVRANSYVVTAVNNRPGLGGEPADALVFDNSPGLVPELPSGLLVNGEPVVGASFRLNLNGVESLLGSGGLPSDPDLADFSIGLSGVSAGDGGGGLDFFSLLSSIDRFMFTPGDYDYDGLVGTSDYVAWRSAFNSDVDVAADGNSDGRVNAADYTLWRDNLGFAGAAAAPEPCGTGLALSILWTGAFNARGRRRYANDCG